MDTALINMRAKTMVILRQRDIQLPAQIICRVPETLYMSMLKRWIDVLIACTLTLLLLSWITLLLFMLIRFSSKGPLFFIQKRIGLRGKAFPCIKFRTMRLNDACDHVQADSDDARITGIGRFLRAMHIDELPQLVNVLLNHMSIVGPRPHMLYHDELFSAMLPQYPLRHLVKPGITGLAQSAGYYGATPDFYSISTRTRLDLFYVNKASASLDAGILLKTFALVLFNRTKNPRV